MIEKTIHYVWLGSDEVPDNLAVFIEGWRRLNPGWSIVKWNEDNFDCQSNDWLRYAVEHKNYPLAADVIRSYILLHHGGVYLDTDVQLLKPLDELVDDNDFFIGYETDYWFGCAVLGAEKGHRIMSEVFDRYLTPFEPSAIQSNMLCVLNFSAAIKRLYGVKLDGKTRKIDDNAMLLSSDYFFPKNYITRQVVTTKNTVAIHQYSSAWFSARDRIGIKVAKATKLVLGKHVFGLFERLARVNMLHKLNQEYLARGVRS